MSLYVPDSGYNHFLAITDEDITKFMVESKQMLKWSSFSITNSIKLIPKIDYWKRAYVTTEKWYNKYKDLFEHLKNMDKNVYVLNEEQKINRNLSKFARNTNYWYKWKRRVNRGEPYFECSSKGDRRFSPFYAVVDGKSIEEWYQVVLKGYSSIQEGKGKPPKKKISKEDLYYEYLKLWSKYFLDNPELLEELKSKAKGKVITDMFAISEINQARALCDICNYGLFE